MKRTVTLALILGMTTAMTAQWNKKIRGNGELITQERSLEDYTGVSLAGAFYVELVPGREGVISLKGESNILDHMVTEVKDGNLTIKAENGYSLSPSQGKGVQISVPVESIRELNLAGSGDVLGRVPLNSDRFAISVAGSGDVRLTLGTDRTEVALSGSGDISLSGSTGELKVSVSGSGDVKAFDLRAETVKVQVSGSADVQVTATQLLEARTSGSGDIRYRGNPGKVDAKSTGSGDVSMD